MSPKQADTLKQSKLDFSATKRTASTGKSKSTTSRLKTNSSQPSLSPAAEPSSKVSVPAENSVKDEIEPAEDLDVDDSESVSSVSTWETLEEKPDTTIAKAPTTTTPAGPSSTRITRSVSQKKTTPGASPKVQPKAEEAVKTPFKQSNATDEQVAQTVQANSQKPVEETYPELKVKAVKYRKYHDELKAKTGDVPTIHGENENKIHQILRFFDTLSISQSSSMSRSDGIGFSSYEYGPCVGVSRRERWDRAQALGLNPPKEVDEILNTKEGRTLSEYSESVFYGQV